MLWIETTTTTKKTKRNTHLKVFSDYLYVWLLIVGELLWYIQTELKQIIINQTKAIPLCSDKQF